MERTGAFNHALFKYAFCYLASLAYAIASYENYATGFERESSTGSTFDLQSELLPECMDADGSYYIS